ncbi:MAG: hypothetical protein WBA40_21605 [Roseiarcus sp.]
MTTRIGSRFAVSQIASVAMAETRLAARAAPDVLRHLAPFVAWATAAIGLGAIVGFAAVVLPPLGAFGIVAMVAVLLLWVMPETRLVYPALIRKTFYVTLVVNLCVPYYYMVQFAGLPWISARRIVAFALILPFLLAVASSSEVRQQIASRLLASPLILICAAGYLVMAILSIPESLIPGESLSALVDSLLEWYVPFVAMIYIIRDEKDIVRLLKIICLCALLNSALGVVEFYFKHRFLVDVFPKSMLAALAESNPMLQTLVDGTGAWRNGIFRATSTFLVPLSFGEFEIIVIPIALFFAMHRQNLFERCLGWTVAIGGIVGILVSGSRGGYVGFLASMGAFIAIWSIRKALSHRTSLAPAIVGTMGAISSLIVGRTDSFLAQSPQYGARGRQRTSQHGGAMDSMAGRVAFHRVKSDHRARLRDRWFRYRFVDRQLRHLASG